LIAKADDISAGIVIDDEAQSILGQGSEIKSMKPRKEDIVQE
jgi:LETM1 and EF-hand domain-containing protein 1